MLAMHPQNNNHDIISEHELKKKKKSLCTKGYKDALF